MTDTVAISNKTDDGYGTFEDRGVRPIQPIAPPPRITAVSKLAERLQKDFGHTADAARAIAEAVEDPRLAREQLSRLSRVPVRGGTLYTLDVRVNALRVLIDPVNPRTVGSTDYPASAESDARAKYWAPRDLWVDEDAPAELVFDAVSEDDLADALDDAKGVIREQNALDESIAMNGVFFPLTVMPWRVTYEDNTETVVLFARDGSSRLNGAQENLGISPSDPIMGAVADPRRSRAIVGEIALIAEKSQEEISTAEAARAHSLMVPARIIISYEPDPGSEVDLSDVVDEYVALLHLDPQEPWRPPAESNKRADIVIEALRREGLLKRDRAAYFAGMLDQESANEDGFPAHPDERAAEIVHFFVKGTSTKVREAIARGIRQLEGKAHARKEYKTPIVASLVLRGTHFISPNKRKSAESTLPRVYMWAAIWDRFWRPTKRTPKLLLSAALKDLENGKTNSAAIIELAIRGSYYLVTYGALGRESFGQSGDEEKDNRTAAAVLAELCRSKRGVYLLYRAIVDGHAGRAPRRVGEDGKPERSGTGKFEPIDNAWLRRTFRTSRAKEDGSGRIHRLTPQEELTLEVRNIRQDVADLAGRVEALETIKGPDGLPIVNELGIPMTILQSIDEEFRMGVMGRLWPYGGIHHGRAHADGSTGDDPFEDLMTSASEES